MKWAAVRAPGPHLHRVLLWTAAALMLGLALPLLAGRIYARDDLANFTLVWRLFYARCLHAGCSPLWTPDIFNGFYLHGEGQGGQFHPGHVLLYGLLPGPLAFDLEVLLPYPILLIGLWVWLRGTLRDDTAALFAALTLAFSGWCVRRHVHINAMQVIVHIPWLLVALRTALTGDDGRRRARGAAAVAALTGSQILLGYPFFVLISVLVELWWFAYLVGLDGAVRRRFWLVVGAKLLGLVLGAVQLVPSWDLLQNSDRALAASGIDPFEGQASFRLLVSALIPFTAWELGAHEAPFHFGYLPLTLALWSVVNRRILTDHRRLVWYLTALALFGLWMALGEHGLLYGLVAKLPLLSGFRVPVRYAFVTVFAVAVLSGLGFSELVRRAGTLTRQETRWLLFLSGVYAMVVVYAAARTLMLGRMEGAFRTALLWFGVVAVFAALALLRWTCRGARLGPALLVVLVGLDLGLYGLPHVLGRTVATPGQLPADLQPPVPRGSRVYCDDLRVDRLALAGYRLVNGYAALYPVKRLDYRHSVAALRLAGAAAAWFRPGDGRTAPAGLVALKDGWYLVPEPLPRVRLMRRARVSQHPSAALAQVDPDREAVVEQELGLDGWSPPGRALLLVDEPDHRAIGVTAPGRQLLVVAESYHSGWRTSVDGERRELLRVYGDFMGVVVGPGDRLVVFSFEPVSQRIGLWTSLVGFVVLAAWFAVSLTAPAWRLR